MYCVRYPQRQYVYFALHPSIYQYYSLSVCGRLTDGILNQLPVNRNIMVTICLNKCTLEGSPKQSYMDLSVQPLNYFIKQYYCSYIYSGTFNRKK